MYTKNVIVGLILGLFVVVCGKISIAGEDNSEPALELPKAQYPGVMACIAEALPDQKLSFSHRLMVSPEKSSFIQNLRIRLDTTADTEGAPMVPAVYFFAPNSSYLSVLSSGGGQCGNLELPVPRYRMIQDSDGRFGIIISRFQLLAYGGMLPDNVEYIKHINFNYMIGFDSSQLEAPNSEHVSFEHRAGIDEYIESILESQKPYMAVPFVSDTKDSFQPTRYGRDYCSEPVHKSVLSLVLNEAMMIRYLNFIHQVQSLDPYIKAGRVTADDGNAILGRFDYFERFFERCSEFTKEELVEDPETLRDDVFEPINQFFSDLKPFPLTPEGGPQFTYHRLRSGIKDVDARRQQFLRDSSAPAE